jgi:3-oxoacyl-[acyl-carrier protein] reductase
MLQGQIALVTGASRGIGAAIAKTLGEQGATVIGTATTAEGAENISKTLREAGITGTGITLDVNNPDQAESTLKAVTNEYGDITVLVNNAGITRDGLFMRMKDEDWDDVISTNLKSVYRMSQYVVRAMMKARAGRIINISSVIAHTGNAGQTNYAAAKGGMEGFTKALAREVAPRNITVNCVAPGFIDTDMTKALPEDHKNNLLQSIPMGRLGQAEDIAATVAFLASPAAAYITGETIHVNGGMYMA